MWLDYQVGVQLATHAGRLVDASDDPSHPGKLRPGGWLQSLSLQDLHTQKSSFRTAIHSATSSSVIFARISCCLSNM